MENKWELLESSNEDREKIWTKNRTFAGDVWFRFRHKPTAIAGLILILVLLVFAFIGPFFTDYSYSKQDLDLVKIAPQAVPPVCKVLDYGKYRFEQQKKEKEAKKNQKVVEVKETRLSLNIDTNDFNTKVNQTAKFLAAGHKVKASIRFRGREMAHSALGADVLKRFAETLPQASMDKPPVLEGRTMSILLIPKPNKD